MNSNDALSSGLRALPTKTSSFASTQAAWRFYKNGSVTLQKLQEPLQQVAQEKTVSHCRGSGRNLPDETFMLEYRYRAYQPGIKEQSVDMAINGSGIRDTARVLKIDKGTIISTIKKSLLTGTASPKTV